MEKRVTKKVEEYQVEFKDNIKKWLKERDLLVVKENWSDGNEDDTSEFLKYIYDYPGLVLSKDDFQKRKRVKNIVPINIQNKCKWLFEMDKKNQSLIFGLEEKKLKLALDRKYTIPFIFKGTKFHKNPFFLNQTKNINLKL